MFAQTNRLKSRAVGYILRKGSKLSTPFFSVCYLPKYNKLPCFTIVIGNKKLPSSPKRARVKRRLRAMMRVLDLIHLSPYDCVVLAQANVYQATWPDLLAQGKRLLAAWHHPNS